MTDKTPINSDTLPAAVEMCFSQGRAQNPYEIFSDEAGAWNEGFTSAWAIARGVAMQSASPSYSDDAVERVREALGGLSQLEEQRVRAALSIANQSEPATAFLAMEAAYKAHIERLEIENRELRQIIADLGYCVPDASLEFMRLIPAEVKAALNSNRTTGGRKDG